MIYNIQSLEPLECTSQNSWDGKTTFHLPDGRTIVVERDWPRLSVSDALVAIDPETFTVNPGQPPPMDDVDWCDL